MKKILENTIIVLLIVVIITLLLFLFSDYFGISKSIVTSGSMEPNIPTGCVLLVNENANFEEIKIGDVIIYKRDGMRIVHRVIEKSVIDGIEYCKTKGDANKIDDGFSTTKENFCGIVILDIPKIGYIIGF